MEGAEFTIYLVSNLSKVKDGTLKPGNGSEFTPEDFIGYDFTDEEVAVTYEDGKEIEVPVLVTDKKDMPRAWNFHMDSMWLQRPKHRKI